MFPDDLTSRSEPQTVAIGACCKKWLENPLQRCFVHTASRIGHRDDHEATGADLDLPNPHRVGYFPHPNLDLDDTWFVHRLCRIIADIQDDLLQLRGFRRYARHFGCLPHRDSDMGR